MDHTKIYEQWCTDTVFDDGTKAELLAISGDEAEIKDRFYRELEFGTGGLRGVMGAGTNRINIYTVRKATQGLADYIINRGWGRCGVAIAYDSRQHSRRFAKEAACCLCANGIPAYVFCEPRPTPQLSFAIRTLGCVAGIVVTASHNPPEYNGYKLYWADGAQITPPRDAEIIDAVKRVSGWDAVKTMEKQAAVEKGLYHKIPSSMDDAYLDAVKLLSYERGVIEQYGNKLGIVYTPLHGTGGALIGRLLLELGFNNVVIVPEQAKPDGNFPTVNYPNPEVTAVFDRAIGLAERTHANIVLATDPDADRLGVCVFDRLTREWKFLDGNMTGALLCDYILARRKKQHILPKDGAVISTIVSGKMGRAIAQDYGVDYIETLTGFKYIGERIHMFEKRGNGTFLFGYEESAGFLTGTHARDKDAVSAAAMLCEAAAYYHSAGQTLYERLCALYRRYGHYRERLLTFTLKGADGARRIAAQMMRLRQSPPLILGGFGVAAIRDYQSGVIKRFDTGQVARTDLPSSDVLYFELDNGAWCCVRPSGTEPKIKYYLGVKGADEADALEKLAALEAALGE